MSAYTEPLAYEATETFRGGRERHRTILIDGNLAEVCELVGARRLVRITRGFIYHDARTGHAIEIEAGFLTDLGSVPAFARLFLSPDDPWAQAYVVHDKIYRLLRLGLMPVGFDRKDADLILYDALGLPYRVYRGAEMHRAICPALWRSVIYRSVRIGGAEAAAA